MSSAILCIDDEISVLLSLKDQLKKEFGASDEIEIAESGVDALEIIEELTEDGINIKVIISDYIMPGMNGDEFLIKAKLLSPNSKKVLLTGQANIEGVGRIINEVGLYRYIAKPWEKNDLVITVKEAIKSFDTEKELEFYTQHLEERVKEQSAQNKTYLEIIDEYLIASKIDTKGIITDVSKAMCEITGFTKNELLGKSYEILSHPDMSDSLYKELWETISAGKTWENEMQNKKKNGQLYWTKLRISPTFDNEKNIIGYASIAVDITDKKKVEELAITDELTKLYNRRYFNKILSSEIQRAIRESRQIGFCIFDVDNFKLYNDNYGHQKGDIVLESLANVIKKNLHRPGDYSFRLGGEEFGIIIYDTTLEGFDRVIQNIKDDFNSLNIEHLYNESFNKVTASFGASVMEPTNENQIDDIYQKTDEFLYDAKKNGRNMIILKELELT